MPDSVKFLLVVAVLGGLGYGAVWGLAHMPPQQSSIVKIIPNDRLRSVKN